jgi:hypothetical protein
MLEGVQGKLRGLTAQGRASIGCSGVRCRSAASSPRSAGCCRLKTKARYRGRSFVTLIFWLAILFTGFSVFAPRHATVVVALIVSALSLSAAIFLILEMGRPFNGFIIVSSKPMRTARAYMGS